MRQTVVGVLLCGLAGCSVAHDEHPGDARFEQPLAVEGRALRRKLREERLELPATMRPAALPSAAAPTTFSIAAPIAPTPDHSGRYVMRRRDSSVFFTSRGFTLSLAGGPKEAPQGWALSATVVGANDVTPLAEHERQDKVHHYVGDPSKWQRDMPTYGQLAWEEIRPGVDMIVEPSRGGFAYRFVLSEGASVSDLALRWDGATALRVVDEGRGLDVETDIGVLHVSGLRAFAVEGDRRRELPARHVARGQDIGLEVDGWDGRTPLVIDPTIAWSSVGGGGGFGKIAIDGSGNVLITGAAAAGFPTSGGFDTTYGGVRDAFVMKVSSAGVLLWSSYLGGSQDDWGAGIAVDASGNAFIAGRTDSTDFPSSGGFQATNGGFFDAFVTKVSASGALLWSSYLGGGSDESAAGIAVDGSGNAFVTGETVSNPPLLGKSVENVDPVTKAVPLPSTATPVPRSLLLPPRYDDQRSAPVPLTLVTNASLSPPRVVAKPPALGKSVDGPLAARTTPSSPGSARPGRFSGRRTLAAAGSTRASGSRSTAAGTRSSRVPRSRPISRAPAASRRATAAPAGATTHS